MFNRIIDNIQLNLRFSNSVKPRNNFEISKYSRYRGYIVEMGHIDNTWLLA